MARHGSSVRRALRYAVTGGIVLAALVLAGCRGASGVTVAAATATAAASATPRATETPSPAATPTPTPTVTVEPANVGQGETLLVSVPGVAAGTTGTFTIAGATHPLETSGRGLWAVAGIPIDAHLGAATATVVLSDAHGAPIGNLSAPYSVVTVDRPVDHLDVTPEEDAVLGGDAGPNELAIRAVQFSNFDPAPRWSGVFQPPLTGDLVITTAFGQGRSINGGPVDDQHTGTDLAEDEGTPVFAPAPGRVSWTGPMPIRGNAVILDHGAGVLSGYHHLHDIVVQPGQMVQTGDLLGHVGHTGFATGPHLHWEVTIYGINVDAMTWLTHPFGPPAQ